jgi:fructosamine-3-kinase
MHQPVEQLAATVNLYFQEGAPEYGLNAATLEVRYVLNWGGFVNHSFTITDGQTAYHLKLAEEKSSQESLRRWAEVHKFLEERYHAPRLVNVIELNKGRYVGLLFEHLTGRTADPLLAPQLQSEICDLLAALNTDRELAAKLQTNTVRTHRDCFLNTFIQRFDEDLEFLGHRLPEFVSRETLGWMQAETRLLESLAMGDAFSRTADAPAHGDLWAGNILTTEDGRFFILDWDELALGDPAMDYAVLLGPLLLSEQATSLTWQDLGLPFVDEAFAARMDVYLRAYLLDWVIDVLADYVDADEVPAHRDEVRAQKQRDHLHYLPLYRQRYG